MTEPIATEFDAPTMLVATTAAGFEREARQELSRVLGEARSRPLMMKGNVLAFSSLEEEKALEMIAEAETRYLSRIVPVQRRVTIRREASCFAALAQAAAEIGRLRPDERFLVRCTRRGEHDWTGRELERAVASELERLTGAVGEYEAEVSWLVSIEVYQGVGFVGVNHPSRVLRRSVGGLRKYAPGERPLNRAEWKIKEALDEFAIELGPDARVLDLGAAPGGWTRVLAGLVSEVVAVDPAELDPRVAALTNVRHLRGRAGDPELAAGLAGPFDLISCDMNLAPEESAGVMCELAPLLKADGWAIMTVKYVTRQRRRHQEEALAKLSECYRDIRMKRLPHNAHETTAVMRRPA